MGKARQVIIGNSAAGLSAVTAIREIDRTCPITLISTENYNAYSPVLLTYYLKGTRDKDNLFIVDSKFYKTNSVETMLGSKATEVNPLKQTVSLESGQEVKYDNLLIATGASPVSLPGAEDGLDNVFTLRTIDDAEDILETAKTAREIIIVGAGLIGLQVVGALFRKGCTFTLIEWSSQVLPELFDTASAAIIQKEIESHGVTVLLGKKVTGIRKTGKKPTVALDSGEELTADLVVVGVGLRPNIQLLRNSGIKINRGILVDEQLRTNISNVFAAGDVSEGKNIVTGRNEVLPNWPNACGQGRIAGLNMAGCEQEYEGLGEAVTTIFGLTAVSIGLPKASKEDGLEELSFSDPQRKNYRKIIFAGNRVAGAVLLGKTADAGLLKNIIRNKRDISPWKVEIARMPLDMRKLLLWSNQSGKPFTSMVSMRRCM